MIILPGYSFTLTNFTNFISSLCTETSRPNCPMTETAQTETAQTKRQPVILAQTTCDFESIECFIIFLQLQLVVCAFQIKRWKLPCISPAYWQYLRYSVVGRHREWWTSRLFASSQCTRAFCSVSISNNQWFVGPRRFTLPNYAFRKQILYLGFNVSSIPRTITMRRHAYTTPVWRKTIEQWRTFHSCCRFLFAGMIPPAPVSYRRIRTQHVHAVVENLGRVRRRCTISSLIPRSHLGTEYRSTLVRRHSGQTRILAMNPRSRTHCESRDKWTDVVI